MTDSAFRQLTEVEQVFKELVWLPAIRAGEAVIEYYVPAFDLPVLKQLEEGTINVIAEAIYNQIVLFVDVSSIKLSNDEHQRAFDDAMVKLKVLSKEKGRTSPEYQKELESAKEDLARFVRYGATA